MQKSLKIFSVLCAFFVLQNSPSHSQENKSANQIEANSQSQNVDAEKLTTDMVIMPKAKIKILNKQLGRVNTSILTIGEPYKFENLEIMIRACYTNKEYDTPENIMFATATHTDSKYTGEQSLKKGNTIFSGWMFSSSPSLSAMEHPIYDIWLLSCEN